MGTTVRGTSSLPRRTMMCNMECELMTALTSAAEEIRTPFTEMMMSFSFTPPLQRERKRGERSEVAEREGQR